MFPFACLIDPVPERAPLAALSALFSPLLRIAPAATPEADARLTVLAPPLPEAEARRLARIAALLSGPDAARQGEQVRELARALLAPAGEAESSGAVLHELRGGRGRETPSASVDPQLLRDLLLLVLTERQAREEAELEAELNRVGAAESRMLARLRDDEDESDDEDGSDEPLPMEAARTPEASAPSRPGYFAAWLRVLERCPLPGANPWFLTGDAALAEALLARHREGGYGEAVVLPEVFLSDDPAASSLPAAPPDILARLQTADAETARRLADEAPRVATGPGPVRLVPRALPGATWAALSGQEKGRNAETSRPNLCLLGLWRAA